MIHPQMEYNASVKKNKEVFYGLIWDYFQGILLSGIYKLQNDT